MFKRKRIFLNIQFCGLMFVNFQKFSFITPTATLSNSIAKASSNSNEQANLQLRMSPICPKFFAEKQFLDFSLHTLNDAFQFGFDSKIFRLGYLEFFESYVRPLSRLTCASNTTGRISNDRRWKFSYEVWNISLLDRMKTFKWLLELLKFWNSPGNISMRSSRNAMWKLMPIVMEIHRKNGLVISLKRNLLFM